MGSVFVSGGIERNNRSVKKEKEVIFEAIKATYHKRTGLCRNFGDLSTKHRKNKHFLRTKYQTLLKLSSRNNRSYSIIFRLCDTNLTTSEEKEKRNYLIALHGAIYRDKLRYEIPFFLHVLLFQTFIRFI